MTRYFGVLGIGLLRLNIRDTGKLLFGINIVKNMNTGANPGSSGKTRSAFDEHEIKREEEKKKFPRDLQGFGYKFNEAGELRDIKTDGGFEFNVKEGDHHHNQVRYEALGDVITEYIYDLLEKETKLKRVHVPIDAGKDNPRSFFFMSEDAMENPDKLMILIHGSGVVRAGQWARRLIINDNLDMGTQIPFIKKAKEEGYGVIVLNTNENEVIKKKKKLLIEGNSTPELHTLYVWDNFIRKAKANSIAIVAHSYGGVVTVNLASHREESLDRVFAVAFTDSVHSFQLQETPNHVIKFFKENAQNWISSDKPLDTPSACRSKVDCPCVSAGHMKHEMTSCNSMDSIFKFLAGKYAAGEKREEL
ncbi:cotranscriptional regulator ARB2A-like isoform X2 [Lineus longissimus]|uniref:cotranscriptional regulator ARB2A-like isoform X2 n=1 Tax=Lineus longissimus TaxID=88925 RepID=UPI002B4D000C